MPAWAMQKFATSVLKPDQVWSPDLSFFGGRYHVYDSVTVPGSDRVFVGHASNTVLDGSLPWTDHGQVYLSGVHSPFAADGAGGAVATSCGAATCRGDTGSRVGVTVTPAEGHRFSHWATPTGERCTLASPGAAGGTVLGTLDCPFVNPTYGWVQCQQRCQAVFVPQ